MFISQNSESSAARHSERTVTIMAAVERDLRPREQPLVYRITYSRADVNKFVGRQAFAEAVIHG